MNDFTFKKSLGQNFLHNHKIIERIVDSSNIKNDSIVIEIGCGNGALTLEILRQNPAKLIVIEIDQRCIDITKEKVAEYSNVEFINIDALKLKIQEVALGRKVHIISNLPYSVGSRIFVNLLSQLDLVESMILMFQKEVAKRIVAKKSTPDYGLLSILAQIMGDVKILFDVAPGNFYPVPKVTSSVIEFLPNAKISSADLEKVIREGKIMFSNRRKMLKSYYNIQNPALLEVFGKKRVEELDVDELMRVVLS